jgi:hypothetical protein
MDSSARNTVPAPASVRSDPTRLWFAQLAAAQRRLSARDLAQCEALAHEFASSWNVSVDETQRER